MDIPKLGQPVANGEGIVITTWHDVDAPGGGRWLVLAVRPPINGDDEHYQPYVIWEYLGNGRVGTGHYYRDFRGAALDFIGDMGASVNWSPEDGD